MKKIILLIYTIFSVSMMVACEETKEELVIDNSNQLVLHYTISPENPLIEVGTDEWTAYPKNIFSRNLKWNSSLCQVGSQGIIDAEIVSATEAGIDVKAYFQLNIIFGIQLGNRYIHNKNQAVHTLFSILKIQEYPEEINQALTDYVIEFEILITVSIASEENS